MNKIPVFFLWSIVSILFGLYICVPLVFSDNVSFGAELVWRIDGKGRYLLPAIAPGSTYTSDSLIMTRGTIESISVTWDAEGPVEMEVSADSGLNYVKAINGVPLDSGFVQGTGLQWRATLGPESKLIEVKMRYRDSSGVVRGFGQPGLAGFRFRKRVFISGSKDGVLFGYQVKIIIGESKDSPGCHLHAEGNIKSDFSDVRFTLTDGETLLPYYLDKIHGQSPLSAAEFFVKIRQIPPEGINLYVYYGNPRAKSVSNPLATFDLYDDFSGGELNAEKWDVRLLPGGSYEFTKDGILLDAAVIMAKNFKFKDGIIEYSATAETGYEARLIIRDSDPSIESDVIQEAYASGYKGAEHCIAVDNIVKVNVASRIAAVTRYEYRVVARGADIVFERYDQGYAQKQASATYRDIEGPTSGYMGLKTSGAGRGRSRTKFHNIRVRKCVETEPVAIVDQEVKEEKAKVPFFDNIALALNGDLILAEGYDSGIYITPQITTAYEARVIMPNWEGSGIYFDVSADGGANYKQNCQKEIYLYASKDDFEKGEYLKGRVIFKRSKTSPAPNLRLAEIQYAIGNIVVLAPNGSETWLAGQQKEIIWTAWDYEKNYPMRIEYSPDGGITYSTVSAATENSGVYKWRLPDKPEFVTKNALIRVSDGHDPSIADTSDNVFKFITKAHK